MPILLGPDRFPDQKGIKTLRVRHDTPEIALQPAKALFNARLAQPDFERKRGLAEGIGALKERYGTPEITEVWASLG